MMTVYDYGRETANENVKIIDVGGLILYEGKVENIPSKFYARKIAQVRLYKTLDRDAVILYRKRK
nr:MAG TPA: hypothetical protein [Caudoviricetes sp.]